MEATDVAVHEAGPMVEGVQSCIRCGVVLTDLRYQSPPNGLTYGDAAFQDGAFIEVGPHYASTTDDPPTCR